MENEIIDYESIQQYLMKFGGGEVLLDRKLWNEGIAILYLNRPEKKNAITGKMMVDLKNHIEELETWREGKAVIICGQGENFCSGGDLDFARQTGNVTGASNMCNWMMTTLSRLNNLDMISVCVARGPTLGGGAEISMFCDYILVTDDVKYGFVHGKMGIITAWGGGTKLIEKIGHRIALELMLKSSLLSAEECIKLGIAEKVISSSNWLEDTLQWLKDYLVHECEVIRSFKRLVNVAKNGNIERCLQCEKTSTCKLWGGDQNRKMLAKRINHCRDEQMRK